MLKSRLIIARVLYHLACMNFECNVYRMQRYHRFHDAYLAPSRAFLQGEEMKRAPDRVAVRFILVSTKGRHWSMQIVWDWKQWSHARIISLSYLFLKKFLLMIINRSDNVQHVARWPLMKRGCLYETVNSQIKDNIDFKLMIIGESSEE